MPFDRDDFEFQASPTDYRYHGRSMPWAVMDSRDVGRHGIDWGKVRLNFGYGDDPVTENVSYLDDYRQTEMPWAWIYAGGLVGVLALVWVLKR